MGIEVKDYSGWSDAQAKARIVAREQRSLLDSYLRSIQGRVRELAPADKGTFSKSVATRITGRFPAYAGSVYSKLSAREPGRVKALEQGRPPNPRLLAAMREQSRTHKRVSWKGFGIPPPGSLRAWMGRHGMGGSEFPLARFIAAHGLRAYRMFFFAAAEFNARRQQRNAEWAATLTERLRADRGFHAN